MRHRSDHRLLVAAEHLAQEVGLVLAGLLGVDVAHEVQAGAAVAVDMLTPRDGTRADIVIRFERGLTKGRIGISPVDENRVNALLFTSVDTLAVEGDTPATIAAEIAEVMGYSLGEVTLEGTAVQSYPLRLQIANSFIAPRLALIGDADLRIVAVEDGKPCHRAITLRIAAVTPWVSALRGAWSTSVW